MNQWVRDALEHSGMTGSALADALVRAGVGPFDKSKVQKMTVARKVSMAEAEAIARITGFPLGFDVQIDSYQADHARLSPERKAVVARLVKVLLEEEQSSKAPKS